MKVFIKALVMCTPLLLLCIGVALAANSGVGAVDTAFTSGGRMITNDLGFGMGLVGGLGVAYSMKHGVHGMGEASISRLNGRSPCTWCARPPERVCP